MIASAHVAAGAVAGLVATRITKNSAGRIALAALLGVASHMGLDAIPHSDYAFLPNRVYRVFGLAESVVACLVVWAIAHRQLRGWVAIAVIAGVAASVAPDVKFVAKIFWPSIADTVTRVGNDFHFFHASNTRYRSAALAGEIVIMLVLFWTLARLSHPSRGSLRAGDGSRS